MKRLFVNKTIINPAFTLALFFTILTTACTNLPPREEEGTGIDRGRVHCPAPNLSHN